MEIIYYIWEINFEFIEQKAQTFFSLFQEFLFWKTRSVLFPERYPRAAEKRKGVLQ